MKDIIIKDVWGLDSIIRETLPNAMVDYCQNFDYIYYGWDICPHPGILIRLGVDINNEMIIKLIKYIIIPDDGTCIMKQMYLGAIPAFAEMEPDFGIVKHMLKNWHAVG